MMRQYPFSILLLSSLILCYSCDLDLFTTHEYTIPEISIINIEQVKDTTYLQLRVEDLGIPIEAIGLAYQIGASPLITDNQLLYEGGNGDIILPVSDLTPEKEYTFIAFAINSFALGKSEEMSFQVPIREALEPPCDLPEMRVIIGGNPIQFNRASGRINFNGLYQVDANASRADINLEFVEFPTTGIYTTVENIDPFNTAADQVVKIQVTFGQWRILKDGGLVYVEKLDENQLRIRFCELYFNNSLVEGHILVD